MSATPAARSLESCERATLAVVAALSLACVDCSHRTELERACGAVRPGDDATLARARLSGTGVNRLTEGGAEIWYTVHPLAQSRADECVVTFEGTRVATVRFRVRHDL